MCAKGVIRTTKFYLPKQKKKLNFINTGNCLIMIVFEIKSLKHNYITLITSKMLQNKHEAQIIRNDDFAP